MNPLNNHLLSLGEKTVIFCKPDLFGHLSGIFLPWLGLCALCISYCPYMLSCGLNFLVGCLLQILFNETQTYTCILLSSVHDKAMHIQH